jgi:protein TonB
VAAALQLRFADGLERAAGVAADASEDTLVVPVEVELQAVRATPSPADAASADALLPLTTASINGISAPAPVPAPNTSLPEQAEARVPAAESAQTFEPALNRLAKRADRPNAGPASRSPAAVSSLAGRAGAGGAAETGGRATVSSYEARVLAHLSRHRIYPPEAQRDGISGISTVRFALAADGHVISAALARGSGASLLDQAAVDMVHRASPFPPIPPEVGRARMDFAAPIRFDLR